MVKINYDYDNTIKSLQKIANTSETITKSNLMEMMMHRVAENKNEEMRFGQALVVLRRKLSEINLKLSLFAASSKDNETTYAVVSASKVKEKSVSEETTVDSMRSTMHSLQMNNQRLFNENEKLIQELHVLQERINALESKEDHYKNVIESFYALAMA